MKALKIIVIIVVAFFAVFLVLGIVAPKDFNMERSVEINAPKAIIYEHISQLKKMDAWSPWAKKDSNIVQEYSGTEGEIGSAVDWSSDHEEVGKGRQEITALEENRRVETKLTFLEPWESESVGYFEMEDGESDGAVKVTWGFSGEFPFPMNAMVLFMDMDAEIQEDFNEGLTALKELTEKLAEENKSSMEYEITETELEVQSFLTIKDIVKWDDMATFFEESWGNVFGAVGTAGLEVSGAPVGIYYTWDEENQETEMAAGVPINEAKEVDGYETVELGGKALQIAYYGSYEKSKDAHLAMGAYMEERGLEMNGPVIESYITNPQEQPDTAQWLTMINYLVK